jgi:hypothetical protein
MNTYFERKSHDGWEEREGCDEEDLELHLGAIRWYVHFDMEKKRRVLRASSFGLTSCLALLGELDRRT